MELTMVSLVQVWNEREIQLMVLLSFMLQLLLLFTGRLRRRNTNRLLRVTVWLAYVGADSVAIYASGLFSQYENKYQSGQQSFGDTLPFLWVPFLLVHLGGQDTITAFSIEDNNLWLRHLLTVIIQVTLSLYAFWKSKDRINSQLLDIAIFVFAAGIIKYGERIWALSTGSREGLGNSSEYYKAKQHNRSKASYALQTVLCAQGLFVGRTVLQLGDKIPSKLTDDFREYAQRKAILQRLTQRKAIQRRLTDDFQECAQRKAKLKIIVMELRMMYDLLYTKAMVLQRKTGVIFRCVAQISTVFAFVLFLKTEKRAHNRANVAITYTLFVGAIFMEACSISMVIVSPWTKACSKEGTFLYWLSRNARSLFKDIQCNKMEWLSNSVGQFNIIDSCISEISTPTLISKVIGAFGLEKHCRNLRYIKRIEAKEITEYILEWLDRPPDERFRQLEFGRKLNYTLCLPFEHALYRLHIYTDLHISRYSLSSGSPAASVNRECENLKEECKKLSNYMIYLMKKYPSMLPVSSAAQDVGRELPKWVRNCGETDKIIILEKKAKKLFNENEPDSASPFEPVENEENWKQSFKQIKEMWVRLLVYAAGKCRGELHALQLGNGGELLTFVWLLMVHHGLGDVATELNLLASDDPVVPELGSVESYDNSNWGPRLQGPIYAFDFRQHSTTGMSREDYLRLKQLEHITQQIHGQLLFTRVHIDKLIEQFPLIAMEENEAGTSREEEQDEAGTSGVKEQDEAETPCETEQNVVTSEIQPEDNVGDRAN